MNYHQFLAYRQSLSAISYPLDDLNPYPLQSAIPTTLAGDQRLLASEGRRYYKTARGVRVLLSELLQAFAALHQPLYLPEDVYPVYLELAGEQAEVNTYQSCQTDMFCLPKEHNAVCLITNPLIPEGRYLSQQQLVALDQWLADEPQRWLLIDTVYDFHQYTLKQYFKASHVIFLGSLSKLCLQPQTQGWALSSAPFLDAVFNNNNTLPLPIAIDSAAWLQQQFDHAWQQIITQQYLPCTWKQPEVGYLTVVAGDYKSLYQQFGIAAVPSRVFGIKNKAVSVISCLAQVKSGQIKEVNL